VVRQQVKGYPLSPSVSRKRLQGLVSKTDRVLKSSAACLPTIPAKLWLLDILADPAFGE
jgi:hypothetical protein